jgi:hypothetical protein
MEVVLQCRVQFDAGDEAQREFVFCWRAGCGQPDDQSSNEARGAEKIDQLSKPEKSSTASSGMVWRCGVLDNWSSLDD